MFKHKRLRSITIFLLLMLSFTFATPTFACLEYVPMLEELIDNSEFVFIGTVINTVTAVDKSMTVQIAVEKYLQGESSSVVEVAGFHDYSPHKWENDGACYFQTLGVGYHAMFFAYRDENILQPSFYNSNYSVFGLYDDITERRATAYITDPFRPVYRLEQQLQRWKYADPFYDLQWAIEDRVRSFKSSTIVMYSLMLVGVLVVNFVARRWWAYKQQPSTKRGNTDKG